MSLHGKQRKSYLSDSCKWPLGDHFAGRKFFHRVLNLEKLKPSFKISDAREIIVQFKNNKRISKADYLPSGQQPETAEVENKQTARCEDRAAVKRRQIPRTLRRQRGNLTM